MAGSVPKNGAQTEARKPQAKQGFTGRTGGFPAGPSFSFSFS